MQSILFSKHHLNTFSFFQCMPTIYCSKFFETHNQHITYAALPKIVRMLLLKLSSAPATTSVSAFTDRNSMYAYYVNADGILIEMSC